jgi:hypothetical protein
MKNWKNWMVFVVLVVLVAIPAKLTGANFSDEEASNGSVSAGTLDLTIDGKSENVKTFDIDLAPGGTGNGSMVLKNDGSVKATLHSSVDLSQSGGASSDSEKDIDPDNQGNLGELVSVTVKRGETTIYNGSLSGLNGQSDNTGLKMNPGDSVAYDLSFTWHSSANDNAGQGDKAKLTFTFTLVQD